MRNILFALLLSALGRPLLAQGLPHRLRLTSPTQWSITTRCNGDINKSFCNLFLKNHYPLLKRSSKAAACFGENRSARKPHDGGSAMGLSRHDSIQELDNGDNG